MNTIPKKQNEELQLQRLSAQRELYTSAKRTYYVQLLSNMMIPVALALISLYIEKFSPYAAAIGTVTFLLDIFILERIIKLKKEKAAKIQELFDCEVLQLAPSPLKTASDITVEEVLTHYHAHSKVATNIEKIKNWYPINIEPLPLHIARLICQRANCYWDANLRNKYLKLIIGIGIVAVLAIFSIGVIRNIPTLNFILLTNALLPLFQFSIKQFYENRDSISRLKELLQYSESTWREAIMGKDEKEVTENSRRLQDEIYNHRSQNPLIPDFIYKYFRNEDESILNKSSEILIKEYSSQNP